MKQLSLVAILLGVVVSSTTAQQQPPPAPPPPAQQQRPQQPPPPPPSISQANYNRAREILTAAKKALIGEKQLPGVDDYSVKITGTLNHRHQSPRADGEPVTTPFDATLLVDYKRGWTIWERTGSFPGGFHFSNRWIFKPEGGVNADLIRRTTTPMTAQNAANFADAMQRRLPQHMLQMAEGRAATLRYLGEVEREGKKSNAIAFAGPTGTQFVLLFDPQSNLLTAWETLTSEPLFGDATNETIFTGYAVVGGIQLPAGQVTKTGNVLTQVTTYSDWKVNAQPAAAMFEPPADLTARPAPSPTPAAVTVNQVAPDAYIIEGLGGGGQRVLFVAFKDFVMVVEAPGNEGISRAAIAKIRETVPNKPIRYIALTHHHDDHSGGLRAYIAEGATIVTTQGNAPYFRRSVQSRFTIAPDGLARNPRPPAADFVQGKAVFTDGSRTLELYDIGPSPHTQEMLIAWLPESKILFQGDLHPDVNGGRGSETLAHFSDWIDKMKLPVEKILGVHGPATATLAELRQAVAQYKAAN